MEKESLKIDAELAVVDETSKLFDLCLAKRLSYVKLSDLTGLSVNNIRRILTCRYFPSIRSFYVLKLAIEGYEA